VVTLTPVTSILVVVKEKPARGLATWREAVGLLSPFEVIEVYF